MITKQDLIKMKIDADDTLKNMDMSKYNKNMFVLAGSALAIKNAEIEGASEEPEQKKEIKKNNFDEYFKMAMKSVKEALSLYDVAEKMASTQDDTDKLKTFENYLSLMIQKKQGL